MKKKQPKFHGPMLIRTPIPQIEEISIARCSSKRTGNYKEQFIFRLSPLAITLEFGKKNRIPRHRTEEFFNHFTF